MTNFSIITDSCCDLGQQMVDKLAITVIPLTLSIDGKEYRNMPDGSDIAPDKFYCLLRDGKLSTTSAVNMQTYCDTFSAELEAGRDVIYLAFSSALSGSCGAARIAADELKEKYPERRIAVIDTISASLGQGLLVTLVCRKRDEGADFDEVVEYAEQIKHNLCHWFTVDDLFHLKRGGRVSGAVAIIGTALGIKPIMHCDSEGRLTKVGTARGRKRSISDLLDKMKATAIDPAQQTVFISHGDCLGEAEQLADWVVEQLGVKRENIYIDYIGPVIGSHSGPATMALFFVGTER